MNTFNSNDDVEFLISNLKHLEAEQSVWKENTKLLQHSIDELRRNFNEREESRQIQSMQQTISQLSSQVAELQLSLSQLSVGDNGFIYPGNHDIINQEEDVDDDEMVSHLLDLMDEEPFEEEAEEIEEQIPVISKAEQEFKAERMMFLLDRIYCREAALKADEFWRCCNEEKDLAGINLAGADLSKANLSSADLREADLSNANLSGAIMPDGSVWGKE